MSNELGDEDTFNILVATDNHLGYMERDPVRGNDSLVTFEEILQLAIQFEVDMVLLGGDLFHENKPSRKVLFYTMELLRKYCMGPRPCALEFLSDSRENFPSNKFGTVNYEDPNLNISLPVFSIHGNHDDPTGDGNLCSLDLLSVTGMLNYFGKAREVDDITVTPVLLKKGKSRLAIYGLGNVRDERLHRTFKNNKVKMLKPQEFQDDWFNLMVLHQNRVKHGPTNYIPETFLDKFIHLVMWGHEHECLIDPEYCDQQEFYVTQPGSSIATALSEGESKSKHVGLLKIRGQQFSMKKIRLKTVRPFILDEVVLSEAPGLSKNNPEGLMVYLASKVESLIDKVTDEWREENREYLEADPNLEMLKPLVRLKVEYSGFTICNVQRFGQQFVNRVANPKDILLFHRRRGNEKTSGSSTKPDMGVLKDEAEMPDQLDLKGVEDLVAEFLENQSLEIFPEKMLTEAVREFVDKDEKDAIKDFISKSLETTREYLVKKVKEAKDEEIKQEVEREKHLRSETFLRQQSKIGDDGLPEGDKAGPSVRVKKEEIVIEEEFDEFGRPTSRPPAKRSASDDDFRAAVSDHLSKFGAPAGKAKAVPTAPKTTRGRGGKATTSRSKSSPQQSQDSDDDDDEMSTAAKAPSKRGRATSTASTRGRGRGAKGAPEGRTLESAIQERRKNSTPVQSVIDLTATNTLKRKNEEPESSAPSKRPWPEKPSFLDGDSGDETPKSRLSATQFTLNGTSLADRWKKTS